MRSINQPNNRTISRYRKRRNTNAEHRTQVRDRARVLAPHRLPRQQEQALDQILGHWVFDQFITASGPRSYRFVHVLAIQYAKTGEPALRRTAERALYLVEHEVLPHWDHDRRTANGERPSQP